MQLVSRKNFIIFLAAILVVAMGIMVLSTSQKSQPKVAPTYEEQIRELKTQSDSDSVQAIDKDLNETDLTDLDKELQDIDKELNQSY